MMPAELPAFLSAVDAMEHVDVVGRADEILATPGIDAAFIGPYDLSNNMGFGVPPQWDNPRFLGTFRWNGWAAPASPNPRTAAASKEN